MKYVGVYVGDGYTMSPPARGAWIEITAPLLQARAACGRPPHGGRGLKYFVSHGLIIECESPPARGAWIEIIRYNSSKRAYFVAPRTGGVD